MHSWYIATLLSNFSFSFIWYSKSEFKLSICFSKSDKLIFLSTVDSWLILLTTIGFTSIFMSCFTDIFSSNSSMYSLLTIYILSLTIISPLATALSKYLTSFPSFPRCSSISFFVLYRICSSKAKSCYFYQPAYIGQILNCKRKLIFLSTFVFSLCRPEWKVDVFVNFGILRRAPVEILYVYLQAAMGGCSSSVRRRENAVENRENTEKHKKIKTWGGGFWILGFFGEKKAFSFLYILYIRPKTQEKTRKKYKKNIERREACIYCLYIACIYFLCSWWTSKKKKKIWIKNTIFIVYYFLVV